MRLGINDDALAEVEKVLAAEPSHPQARLEKANLLYLSQKLPEARDSLRQGIDDGSIAPGPGVWNLLGNAEYALGNWAAAVDSYRQGGRPAARDAAFRPERGPRP